MEQRRRDRPFNRKIDSFSFEGQALKLFEDIGKEKSTKTIDKRASFVHDRYLVYTDFPSTSRVWLANPKGLRIDTGHVHVLPKYSFCHQRYRE